MATWDTYITDIEIPKEWKCTSWGNDGLPSYQHNGYHIWLDSWDDEERKINAKDLGGDGTYMFPRFTVTFASCYNGECEECTPDCFASNFETDSFSELVSFINKDGLTKDKQ